jgi:hypothetical protein
MQLIGMTAAVQHDALTVTLDRHRLALKRGTHFFASFADMGK